MRRTRRSLLTLTAIYLVITLGMLWVVRTYVAPPDEPEEVAYSEFLAELRAGRVEEVRLAPDRVLAELAPAAGAGADAEGRTIVATRLPGIDDEALLRELDARDVVFAGEVEEESALLSVLIAWSPLLLLVALYWFVMRRMMRRAGPLQVGKVRPKIHDRNADNQVTFADVAGVEEAKAELMEVVSFLKDPSRYRALGAKIPKGVLLVGSPGTGKTLLARAVAGEADVPFFSLSGSEFVEMFVGVGAARMRSLFEQAKERAPCIIFIDELDAIGKARGGGAAMATHDEREQTLNQLLVEMDGFDPGRGVILMGATNRPEVLDQALLRPGRFDRRVVVDRPTAEGRLAILRVHARNVRLSADVDLEAVARRTVGMVGADLANVVNEAALAAGRRAAGAVEARDFETAVDRIQLGLERRGRVMTDSEKRRVAYHEAGHALIALSVEHADPVHRVSIIPRSIGALGVTLQLPTEDRYLVTRHELLDRICVMLGGRAAEQLVCDDVSTGAHNDLERATETARQMVTRFGMSEALGLVTYGRPMGARFLQAPFQPGEERNFSEETARRIDAEVRAIVERQYERSLALLADRRAVLERITADLLERETVERDELVAMLEAEGFPAIRHAPTGEPEAMRDAARERARRAG